MKRENEIIRMNYYEKRRQKYIKEKKYAMIKNFTQRHSQLQNAISKSKSVYKNYVIIRSKNVPYPFWRLLYGYVNKEKYISIIEIE